MMKKRFIVTESSNTSFIREVFEIETRIKKDVELPFTTDLYRCTMFTGIRIKLVSGEEYIIADLY